ncbi:MAG: hypothetical protein J1G02_02865 [Clostridiales bacterium]|nr:hypothetical protein [Clostridiales bacterium]
MVIIEIFAFAVLLVLIRRRQSEVRRLSGIVLDTVSVRREFTVGDEFECDGLVVQAIYNLEPTSENIVDYVVLTEEELNHIKSQDNLNGCYVVKPDMNEAGKKTITVVYQDKISCYSIAIAEPVEESVAQPVEEPTVASVVTPVVEEHIVSIPVVYEEESFEGRMHYDKSFSARLIQSDDETKQWYTELKNELLSYKKIKSRKSWKRETFRAGKEVVAKISFRGKTMCLYLPLNAADFAETKYHVEDVSDVMANADTPMMYRMKNARRVKYAADLIAMVTERLELTRDEDYITEDFYVPYEGIVELINKGLIKRLLKSVDEEPDFLQGNTTENVATDDDFEPQEIAPGVFVTKKD